VGLYSTGDPFITKNLDQYISIAKNLNIKRVYITTNGALANFDKAKKCIDAGLDSIKFSINAGTKESYKIIHGFDDFEKVKKNVRDIYEYIKINQIQ
jgi:molybdenum cofactor biosynthesis enzyme MoaA